MSDHEIQRQAGIAPSVLSQIRALRQRVQDSQRFLEPTKALNNNSNDNVGDSPSLMSETVALRQRTQQSQRLLEVAKTLNNGSNGDFGDSSSYMKELQERIEREHKIVDERLRLRLIGERSGVK